MFYRNLIIAIFLCSFSFVFSQTKNYEWQLGVGFGIAKFSNENAIFIEDADLLQIPRLNITAPITDHISVDAAVSVNTFDLEIIKNNAFYFSLDGSVRYHVEVTENFMPYVFTGVSLVDSSYKLTATLNVGAGATYWVNNLLGFNAQAYYKYSPNSFESMRSHIQLTGSMVFAIDMFDLLIFGKKGKVCF